MELLSRFQTKSNSCIAFCCRLLFCALKITICHYVARVKSRNVDTFLIKQFFWWYVLKIVPFFFLSFV